MRLVGQGVSQVMHVKDNSLFCVLISLDIRCSPNSLLSRFYNIDPSLAVIIGNGRASEIFGISDRKFM
jgi:hypothetical protein